jgi:WD40 repeat protein
MRAIMTGLCVAGALLLGSPLLAAEERVALVIGQSDYQSLSKLANPVPDAKAIAAALREHGFHVTQHYDLPRAELLDALEEFTSTADQAEVALVYYAGHGMEIAGRNVLAPKDMEIDCEKKTPRRAIDLDQIFAAVSGAPSQIVLLDACRNDPFPQCPSRSAGTGSGFRGFARVTAEGRSLLVANATLSGQLAADGDPGAHSPFAGALLARFSSDSRAYLRDLLDLTAADVSKSSRGAQVPEILTRGGAPRICLDLENCGGAVAAEAKVESAIPASPRPSNLDQAARGWADVQGTESAAVLEAFLREFPDGFYAELARAKLENLKRAEPVPSSAADSRVAAVEQRESEKPSSGVPSLVRSFGPFQHDVVSVAFSPDGNRMYALVSGGYFMKLDPASGEVGAELGLGELRTCCKLAVSPDGKYLASGNYDKLALLWDAETGKQLRSFEGHSDHVVSVAFSPDGKQIVSGSYDGTIRVWEVESGKQVRSLDPRKGKVYSIALSPDGKLIASGHVDGDIKVWDAANGRLLNSEKANDYGVYSLVFSPDGSRLLSTGADAKVRVWDLAAKKEVTSFGEGYSSLCCVAISPDGRTAAAGGTDDLIRLWDVASGSLLSKLEHSDWIQTVVFSPDGSLLASGANDKTVKLWELGGAQAAAR